RVEEGLGAGQRAQLVRRGGGDVEQDRLGGLLGQDGEALGGDGEEGVREDPGAPARNGETGLQQVAPRAVALVQVGLGGRLGEQRAVAGEVAGGEERAGAGGQRL